MVQVVGIEPTVFSIKVAVLQTAAVAAEPHLHIQFHFHLSNILNNSLVNYFIQLKNP